MIDTVHVVFKTHLDLGFTALAEEVLDAYVTEWIPRALDLADDLHESPGASFVWTTGSWLVKAYLDRAAPEGVARMERAIGAGTIAWHALPLSTHTELMDGALVDYGLSISHRLDRRFGRSTIAAKMTDVPGHTIGLVPHLAAAGVRYLHVGVNPVSALPDVPELFVWRAPGGSEVVTHYQGSYGSTDDGEAFCLPGMTDALYVAHTNDNQGPPSRDEVEALFVRLRARHPGALVVASTFDAFANAVETIRPSLPVVEDEIGDTWIHGAAADPLLLSQFRSLLRARSELVATGELTVGSTEYDAFSDPLLLVAEHTWGKDRKTFLPDDDHYDAPDFAAARARNVLPGSSLTYSALEASWAEQRARIDEAVDALSPAHRDVALTALRQAPVRPPSGSGRAIPERLGSFTVRFGHDGAITSLTDDSGNPWFDDEHVAGRFAYTTFDADDYDDWVASYCRDMDANAEWALPDQTKQGLVRSSTARAAEFRPRVTTISHAFDSAEDADVVTMAAKLPDEAAHVFGAPERLTIEYRFSRSTPLVDIAVTTHGKSASRLPEAATFEFTPVRHGQWSLTKIGTEIDPRRVVARGNRALHAVESIRLKADDRRLTIVSDDAPVVALGAARLLRFDDVLPDPDAGARFVLHDNLWPTNFPQWFGDDLTYRFRLTFDRA